MIYRYILTPTSYYGLPVSLVQAKDNRGKWMISKDVEKVILNIQDELKVLYNSTEDGQVQEDIEYILGLMIDAIGKEI